MNAPVQLSKLHKAALSYVEKKYRVIPVVPGQKTPMLKAWHENAFTTAEQVNAHWSQHPESNIAICPEDNGYCIVEQDPGGSVEGLNLPETYEVESPRGGTHYYFLGSLPPSVGKLAPHVDTRGKSSYVLVPPSVVNGKTYRVKAKRPVAVLPPEIGAKMAERADARQSDVHEADVPGNYERGRDRLRKLVADGRVAIEGRGGDNFTYQISCELIRDLGLSVDRALELMEAEFNPHCQPPWSPEELRAKLEHAASYGQNEAGAYASEPASAVFQNIKPQSLGAAATAPLLQPVPFAALAERKVEPVAELVPGLIERGIATMLSGPGGVHKSRLALQFGLALQAGIPIFGRATVQSSFWYLDYENGANEIVRRLHKLRYGLKLPGLGSAQYFDFKAPRKPNSDAIPDYEAAPALATVTDEMVTPEPFYYELYDALKATPGHKFVVLDSTYNVLRFTSQAKINETAVKAALNLLDHLCAATDSTILYLWHPSRAGMERGDASGWSVAWENTPRARLSISRVENSTEAFTLKVEKRNNGPTGEQITLHWTDGTLLPVTAMSNGGQVFMDECIALAIEAAEGGDPIKKRRKVSPAQLAHLERVLGFRPTPRDVADKLEEALLAKRLRYIAGKGHTIAGYYPYSLDPCMAETFAEDAAREREREHIRQQKAAGEEASVVPADYGEDLELADKK